MQPVRPVPRIVPASQGPARLSHVSASAHTVQERAMSPAIAAKSECASLASCCAIVGALREADRGCAEEKLLGVVEERVSRVRGCCRAVE